MSDLLRYRGDSMAGTLSDGDVLLVSRDSGTTRPGEIVVYVDEGGGRVVHRFHAVAPGGWLLTKGDAAKAPDDRPVPPERVQGRVVGVLRVTRPKPARALRRLLARMLGPLYRWAARRAALRRSLRSLLRLDLRRLTLRGSAGGELIKVLHRGRTVAWLYPRTGRMRSRCPYALVVDPPPPRS